MLLQEIVLTDEQLATISGGFGREVIVEEDAEEDYQFDRFGAYDDDDWGWRGGRYHHGRHHRGRRG
jgi:bacteriocin-like protein